MNNRVAPVLDQATLEKSVPAKWQGMTVTFKDRLENLSYKEQFNKTAYRLCRHLQKMCSIFEFYPEFTDTGRIHYHGKYKPKSKYKALTGYQTLRQYGFIKIETQVKDMSKWDDYIQKDYKESRRLIGREIKIDEEFYRVMAEKDCNRLRDMEHQLKLMTQDLADKELV